MAKKRITITDKYGESYQLIPFIDDADYLEIEICDNNTPVGVIKCLKHGRDKFEVADIYIYHPPLSSRSLKSRLVRFLLRRPTPSYRGRDIAPAALDYVKQYAKGQGFSCITGKIISHEMPLSVLIPWYQEQGFIVDTTSPIPTLFLDLTKER